MKTPRQLKPIRPVRIEGELAYVTLTKGYEAVIDASDAAAIGLHNWRAQVNLRKDGTIKSVYAARGGKATDRVATVMMHRFIAGTPAGFETDHKDDDGLNNTKANLRIATVSQNQYNRRLGGNNTSGAKGVYRKAQSGKWAAQIVVAGKRQCLGCFQSVEAAASAYAEASIKHHGEFGRTDITQGNRS